jgi:hypothetical protein
MSFVPLPPEKPAVPIEEEMARSPALRAAIEQQLARAKALAAQSPTPVAREVELVK